MNNPLISIITPAYNSALFIEETISSVLEQTYQNWELLIVNDGSTDNTEEIINQYSDQRIRYFKKENGGVSSARNIGLKEMKGDYFCFLDADDTFPENSLENRLKVFKESEDTNFVDGKVLFWNSDLSHFLKEHNPDFKGNPIPALCALDSACFFGNTWMFRRNKSTHYRFLEGLTHGEDLLFYLEFAKSGKLDFTSEPILNYRTGNVSAMTNLKGLEKGYRTIAKKMKSLPHISDENRKIFKSKTRLIMFKSYIGAKQPLDALKVFLSW